MQNMMSGFRGARIGAAFFASVLAAGGALAAATTYINTATHKESGFSNGALTPFPVDTNNTTNGNYVIPFTKNGQPAVKTYWAQANYTGTRATKGAEAMSPTDLKFYSDGWFALRFQIPTGFPSDKDLAIAQIFSRGRCTSWSAILVIKDNDLVMRSRNGNGCGSYTDRLILSGISRDVWHSAIMRFKVSKSNLGELKVWYGNAAEGAPTINLQNINFGDGDWVGDTLDPAVANNYIGLKFGQYNHDTADYTPGEFRVVYFDDVSMLNGNPTGAFAAVNPN